MPCCIYTGLIKTYTECFHHSQSIDRGKMGYRSRIWFINDICSIIEVGSNTCRGWRLVTQTCLPLPTKKLQWYYMKFLKWTQGFILLPKKLLTACCILELYWHNNLWFWHILWLICRDLTSLFFKGAAFHFTSFLCVFVLLLKLAEAFDKLNNPVGSAVV